MEPGSTSEPMDCLAFIPMSIGTEFVAWASQYWKLKDRYENEKARDPSSRGVESCDSEYVMDCFQKKIDELIETRMRNYGIIG